MSRSPAPKRQAEADNHLTQLLGAERPVSYSGPILPPSLAAQLEKQDEEDLQTAQELLEKLEPPPQAVLDGEVEAPRPREGCCQRVMDMLSYVSGTFSSSLAGAFRLEYFRHTPETAITGTDPILATTLAAAMELITLTTDLGDQSPYAHPQPRKVASVFSAASILVAVATLHYGFKQLSNFSRGYAEDDRQLTARRRLIKGSMLKGTWDIGDSALTIAAIASKVVAAQSTLLAISSMGGRLQRVVLLGLETTALNPTSMNLKTCYKMLATVIATKDLVILGDSLHDLIASHTAEEDPFSLGWAKVGLDGAGAVIHCLMLLLILKNSHFQQRAERVVAGNAGDGDYMALNDALDEEGAVLSEHKQARPASIDLRHSAPAAPFEQDLEAPPQSPIIVDITERVALCEAMQAVLVHYVKSMTDDTQDSIRSVIERLRGDNAVTAAELSTICEKVESEINRHLERLTKSVKAPTHAAPATYPLVEAMKSAALNFNRVENPTPARTPRPPTSSKP